MNDLLNKAARLADINDSIDALKKEKDELEGYFLEKASFDLANSKQRSVSYTANGVKVVATLARTVKLIYPSLLEKLSCYKDIVKEEKSYTLTTAGKRLMGGICAREYIEQSIAEVIEQIAPCEKRALLLKKLKGKAPESDKKNLVAILGVSEEEAEIDAFLINEAAIWEEFEQLSNSMGLSSEERLKLIDTITAAVIVDESAKLRIERTA